jgi:hypothetical protein
MTAHSATAGWVAITSSIIEHSVIHYTVRPEVSKGKIRINPGLRYLSPNGAIVANYGTLNKGPG